MLARGIDSTAPARRRLRAGRVAGLAGMALLLVVPAAARADLAMTTITTVASSSVPVGGSLSDTAVVTHGTATPTGTITFKLYDVTDTKCAGTPVFTQTIPFAFPAMSAAYTPTKAGTYTWIGSYSGDTVNAPSAGTCDQASEKVTVTPVTPKVTLTTAPSVPLGGTTSASAVLTGGYKPGGTITFRLYGANDPNCTGAPIFTTPTPVASPTVSTIFRPTAAGTYHWVATYNGDAANTAASSACADPGAAVTVVGGPVPAPPPTALVCDSAGMAKALLTSLVNVLTGGPNTAFKATCSAGVRIVLRAREIRPGNPGFPHRDGFTTIANTLTHSTTTGSIAFAFNAQGIALRNYASSHGQHLMVFAIVHVRPDRTQLSSEALQVFTL